MKKVALLIGVSEYGVGLNPLPCAVKDVEAMEGVLKHPEIGNFDEVKSLINPHPQTMHEEIESLFSGRTNNDLVVLYFSGHGIKDDSGRLYFATGITRKNPQGELIKATAVPASFVHDAMGTSRSKRQVLILDCCFSGAFAKGLSVKDDGSVDIKNLFGSEGRVVLTSSTSTQYSFEQQHQGLDSSIYTRYLVEGIETGMADRDHDGMVSVDELHEYTSEKVREAQPTMKPEIYPFFKEGFKIKLTKAPILDPKLAYSRNVERLAKSSGGKISEIGRIVLDELCNNLGLLAEEAKIIEADVLRPYQEYERKLRRYEEALLGESRHHWPLSEGKQQELKELQEYLKLKDEDIKRIQKKVIPSETIVQQAVAVSKSSVSVNYWKRANNFLTHNTLYVLSFSIVIITLPFLVSIALNSVSKELTQEECKKLYNEYQNDIAKFQKERRDEKEVKKIKNKCKEKGVEFPMG
jgi:uncharacterized caspase-like protein